LDAFRPDHPGFRQSSQFRQKLTDIQEVSGKTSRNSPDKISIMVFLLALTCSLPAGFPSAVPRALQTAFLGRLSDLALALSVTVTGIFPTTEFHRHRTSELLLTIRASCPPEELVIRYSETQSSCFQMFRS
jgi:hypothetical protein